jgi:hypothetical protein
LEAIRQNNNNKTIGKDFTGNWLSGSQNKKTSNNLVFLRFIGMLRDKYLERDNENSATFQSVILSGVYDIKNLKLKMIQSDFGCDGRILNPQHKNILNIYVFYKPSGGSSAFAILMQKVSKHEQTCC